MFPTKSEVTVLSPICTVAPCTPTPLCVTLKSAPMWRMPMSSLLDAVAKPLKKVGLDVRQCEDRRVSDAMSLRIRVMMSFMSEFAVSDVTSTDCASPILELKLVAVVTASEMAVAVTSYVMKVTFAISVAVNMLVLKLVAKGSISSSLKLWISDGEWFTCANRSKSFISMAYSFVFSMMSPAWSANCVLSSDLLSVIPVPVCSLVGARSRSCCLCALSAITLFLNGV